MATFVMLGKMSSEGMRQISPQRTVDALALIQKHGAELKSGFVMLGEYELLLVLELPGTEQVMQLSVALSNMLGVKFTTSPAITFEEFDRLSAQV